MENIFLNYFDEVKISEICDKEKIKYCTSEDSLDKIVQVYYFFLKIINFYIKVDE
jgi:hypothetical protein